MISWIIHFYDSLSIVLILDPGCEFFCAKCIKLPLMKNLSRNKFQNLFKQCTNF